MSHVLFFPGCSLWHASCLHAICCILNVMYCMSSSPFGRCHGVTVVCSCMLCVVCPPRPTLDSLPASCLQVACCVSFMVCIVCARFPCSWPACCSMSYGVYRLTCVICCMSSSPHSSGCGEFSAWCMTYIACTPSPPLVEAHGLQVAGMSNVVCRILCPSLLLVSARGLPVVCKSYAVCRILSCLADRSSWPAICIRGSSHVLPLSILLGGRIYPSFRNQSSLYMPLFPLCAEVFATRRVYFSCSFRMCPNLAWDFSFSSHVCLHVTPPRQHSALSQCPAARLPAFTAYRRCLVAVKSPLMPANINVNWCRGSCNSAMACWQFKCQYLADTVPYSFTACDTVACIIVCLVS